MHILGGRERDRGGGGLLISKHMGDLSEEVSSPFKVKHTVKLGSKARATQSPDRDREELASLPCSSLEQTLGALACPEL